ncbi:HEPN domain-containing protein [Roseivirga sp. BDSF3-8]|uniref:HEPN domain-containing protein n=1 Tax=Roseivirga sp. BDSF3-8 TaxID=3241598 RepID=UPI003531D26F
MENHVKQSRYNLKFLDTLESEQPSLFFDWKCTIAFYCALHAIKAMLVSKGIPTSSHEDIRSVINHRKNASSPVNIECYKAYNRLYNICMTSRYDGFKNMDAWNDQFRNEFDRAKQDLTYILKYLQGKHDIKVYKNLKDKPPVPCAIEDPVK